VSSPSPSLLPPTEQPAFRKPRADVYTALLIISLVAIIVGCICLWAETDPLEYPGKPPYKNLPAVSMSTGKGDSPHLCEAPSGRAPTKGWSRQMGTVPFFRLGPAAIG